MGLVTYDYYSQTYLGEPVASDSFARYERRAEKQVLVLINRTADDAAHLPEGALDLLRMSICAQIEYLWENGIEVAVSGSEGGGGFTVGKVSIREGGGSSALSASKTMLAPAVYAYLERTGLLYPGVPVVDMPPQVWGWWL